MTERPAGLVLAAGAGRRFGKPKALVRIGRRTFVRHACDVLSVGGCGAVWVVLGACADDVRTELPDTAHAVYTPRWQDGMGESLRAGLARLARLPEPPEAVLVHLVDLPDVPAGAVRRVAACTSPDAVARACYDGVPGHPVLLGRHHWDEILESLSGDEGARQWLRGRDDLRPVECGDLGTGQDVDTPDELTPYARGCDNS